MGWIDADAHVVEGPHTWDYLPASEQRYRPVLCDVQPASGKQAWYIDGKMRGLVPGLPTDDEKFKDIEEFWGRSMATPRESREARDLETRLRHLDALGIEAQVVYPTVFLDQCAERAAVDVALCGAYNRWLADVWKEAGGRIRWMALLPFLSIPDALDQMRFAKDNGACGVFMRPIEGTRLVNHPDFFPIYEQAAAWGWPVGVHQANGNAGIVDFFSTPEGGREFFNQYRIFTVGSFFLVVQSGLTKMFPGLKIGFIETAASWVPWVTMELESRKKMVASGFTDNLLRDYDLFVTCQSGDDVPYLVSRGFGNNLMIGTDYGHVDASTELDSLHVMAERQELTKEAVGKIAEDNARVFYGL